MARGLRRHGARRDPGGARSERRAGTWRNLLAHGAAATLAERDGAVVGFSSSGRQRDASLPYTGEIYAVYVLRHAQRLGIGRALMAAAAGDLLAQDHAAGMLWVLETNVPARRFYQALGGREVLRRSEQRDGFAGVGVAYAWDDLRRLV